MKARATRGAFESYVVERGDTLASVARKTKTRAEVILLLNPHASASALSRGMVLDVPRAASAGTGRSRTGRRDERLDGGGRRTRGERRRRETRR